MATASALGERILTDLGVEAFDYCSCGLACSCCDALRLRRNKVRREASDWSLGYCVHSQDDFQYFSHVRVCLRICETFPKLAWMQPQILQYWQLPEIFIRHMSDGRRMHVPTCPWLVGCLGGPRYGERTPLLATMTS